MAKPIIFGPFNFRTKKAATEEIRNRINKYDADDKLNPSDQLFFEELFKLHDEHDDKVGAGVQYIQVQRDFNNNRCLYIYRVDGSSIDISWVHCVRPASIKSTVSMAFRRAVKGTITTFKSQCINESCCCPVLNISLNFHNSHVSYVERSFDSLLSGFLEKTNNTYDSIVLENPKLQDSDQRGIVKNSELKEAWVGYHQKMQS